MLSCQSTQNHEKSWNHAEWDTWMAQIGFFFWEKWLKSAKIQYLENYLSYGLGSYLILAGQCFL